MMLGVDDCTKQCVVNLSASSASCVSVGLSIGYSPERWARRREASRQVFFTSFSFFFLSSFCHSSPTASVSKLREFNNRYHRQNCSPILTLFAAFLGEEKHFLMDGNRFSLDGATRPIDARMPEKIVKI